MQGKVYNRFKELLALKERANGRRITYEEITNATGIAGSNLSAWSNNKVSRYDADMIARLCDFFECSVGDLIVYEKEKE